MEGTAQIRVASRSVFGGVEDVIRMEGTAAVEKTEHGWHLQYEAVNCEDERPPSARTSSWKRTPAAPSW